MEFNNKEYTEYCIQDYTLLYLIKKATKATKRNLCNFVKLSQIYELAIKEYKNFSERKVFVDSIARLSQMRLILFQLNDDNYDFEYYIGLSEEGFEKNLVREQYQRLKNWQKKNQPDVHGNGRETRNEE